MPIPPLPVYDPQRRQLVCMIDTDTRENVDPKLFYDKLEELEGVRILEKSAGDPGHTEGGWDTAVKVPELPVTWGLE